MGLWPSPHDPHRLRQDRREHCRAAGGRQQQERGCRQAAGDRQKEPDRSAGKKNQTARRAEQE